MRITILGTGALATVYGVYLHRAGHEVMVIGRGQSLSAVRTRGLRLHDWDGRDVTARVETLDTGEVATGDTGLRDHPPEYLLVCTKAIGTLGQLQPLALIRPGAALSFQNGLLKDDFLVRVFPHSDLVGAATLISATRTPDGSVTLVNRSTTLLAAAPSLVAAPHAAALLATELHEAGLPAALVPNRTTLLWSKVTYTGAGFGASILTRLDIGSILTTPPLRELFLDLIREGAAIAAAQGAALNDYPGLPAHSLAELPRHEALALLATMGERLSQAPAPLRVSLLQDLDAGRPTEAREVLGPLVDAAHTADLPVPLLETAYRVVSGIDTIGHVSAGSNNPTSSSTA